MMVKALLDLPKVPQPADAADALAAAICHIHSSRLREMLKSPAAARQAVRGVASRSVAAAGRQLAMGQKQAG
jgi:hypothetical protein